ncbi:predicted protein [Naegleria gruberi]|uniref:Predicted protein n=1 Tax=Naegleria gruberi TaxID=5762 RepID=D2VIX6_NAEGR|nr:uncharacterized protein NAEGRDRAFT_68834 [Naegleria gruberi]EFC43179.1 predicted protein [Naegleria gruberi]|eukprot:XP_002675923.1 predicted protein [Naegleria gruberi strain NEG-M]
MVVLTNVFGPTADTDHLISRGFIVNGICLFPKKLKSSIEIEELRKNVLDQYFGEEKHMRGFNIIMGNLDGVNPMFYMTNRDDQAQNLLNYYKIEEINNEIHIVSNTYLDDCRNELYKKYKLDLLKNLLEKTVKENREITDPDVMLQKLEKCITNRFREHFKEEEQIINHLTNIEQLDHSKDPSLLNLIPQHFMKDGAGPLHFRSRLDSHYNIYVNKTYFKTRSQTIILMDNQGNIHYYYRDTDPLFMPENDSEINKSNSIPWTHFKV